MSGRSADRHVFADLASVALPQARRYKQESTGFPAIRCGRGDGDLAGVTHHHSEGVRVPAERIGPARRGEFDVGKVGLTTQAIDLHPQGVSLDGRV